MPVRFGDRVPVNDFPRLFFLELFNRPFFKLRRDGYFADDIADLIFQNIQANRLFRAVALDPSCATIICVIIEPAVFKRPRLFFGSNGRTAFSATNNAGEREAMPFLLGGASV